MLISAPTTYAIVGSFLLPDAWWTLVKPPSKNTPMLPTASAVMHNWIG